MSCIHGVCCGVVEFCIAESCKVKYTALLLRWGVARLGQVRIGSAGLTKLLSWHRGVESSPAGSSGALFSKVRCYRGFVRSAAVAWGSAGLGKLLSWCRMVLNIEALSCVVAFRSVKHGTEWHSKLLLRRGFGKVKRGLARCSSVRFASLLLMYGLANKGGVRRATVNSAFTVTVRLHL